MEFTATEVQYYATMWLLAFSAGVFRTLRDRDYQSLWDCVCAGGVGGFYAFAVVSICSYRGPSVGDFGWGYLGMAVAIGVMGKEQDQLMRALFRAGIDRAMKIIGGSGIGGGDKTEGSDK